MIELNKIYYFIVGTLIIFLLCISVSFASTEVKSTDAYGDLEPRDYGEFTMDTPSDIEFDEYRGVWDSHVFYCRNLMMVYINYKDKVDSDSVYHYHLTEAELIHPKKVSNNDFSGKMVFYKEHMNEYVATYENEDYVIVIRYDYINDLVDMTRTIEIN